MFAFWTEWITDSGILQPFSLKLHTPQHKEKKRREKNRIEEKRKGRPDGEKIDAALWIDVDLSTDCGLTSAAKDA